MNKKIVFCVLFYTLFIKFAFCMNKSYTPPLYVQLAEEAQEKMGATLAKKNNMHIFGTSEALFDQINELGLSFQIKGPISKDKLRYILIDCINEYLSYINANEKMRPFLKNYPFKPQNIKIKIFVVGSEKNNYNLFYPDISVASAFGSKLYFKTNDPENEYKYKTEEVETYEEALRIVKEQYPDVIAD